ncbi:hypothetical protein MBLNU13_g11253t3 [Cladosporium sp. NU13]
MMFLHELALALTCAYRFQILLATTHVRVNSYESIGQTMTMHLKLGMNSYSHTDQHGPDLDHNREYDDFYHQPFGQACHHFYCVHIQWWLRRFRYHYGILGHFLRILLPDHFRSDGYVYKDFNEHYNHYFNKYKHSHSVLVATVAIECAAQVCLDPDKGGFYGGFDTSTLQQCDGKCLTDPNYLSFQTDGENHCNLFSKMAGSVHYDEFPCPGNYFYDRRCQI